MTEEKAVSTTKPAPLGWGTHEEVREISNRLRRFVPGTKKMNDDEVMAYAQLVLQTGLNPCRHELYGWDSNGDSTGELITKLYYGILVRWAMSQEPFTTRFTTELDPKSNEIVCHCRLMRQSNRQLLSQLLSRGVEYQEALTWATTEGLGIVTAHEKTKRKPPHSKSWPWVAEKRALEDAIKFAYGSPSTEELARQTWIVEGVVTIPPDWQEVTPEMLPAEREALALANARQRERQPLKQTAAQSIADLGFEEPPATEPQEPELAEDAEESPPKPPETLGEDQENPPEYFSRKTREALGNGNGITRPAAAEIVKGWLVKKAQQLSHYRAPTPDQLGLMNGLLSKILGGDKERHTWLEWTWGTLTSKGLPGGKVSATLDWLKPVKDAETGEYIPLELAVSEAKMMLRQALLDKGQADMFDEIAAEQEKKSPTTTSRRRKKEGTP